MSTEKLNKIYFEYSYEEISETDTDISQLVIPFSKIFNSHRPIDIYSGTEKIPFKKRDPEYKIILKQEFSHLLTAL